MSTPLPSFPLRRTRPIPWRPMTDAEWEALSALLRHSGPGRPPRDARRTWNAIFWVACSTKPWRALPPEFGRADSAHRTLRRAAASRLLHRMLLRVSDHPLLVEPALIRIEWFIARAFRRAFRVAPAAIAFARRLGLAAALPAEPWWLPKPDLSETLHAMTKRLSESRTIPPLPLLDALLCLARSAAGRPQMWRTTG